MNKIPVPLAVGFCAFDNIFRKLVVKSNYSALQSPKHVSKLPYAVNSLPKAYSVATFYENFSFDAKGKYVIKVCDGTACHVRKSMPVLEALYKKLGLSSKKKTTDDMMFTVETVSCLGACGLAPTMMVNDDVYPRMTPEKADELIDTLRGGDAS